MKFIILILLIRGIIVDIIRNSGWKRKIRLVLFLIFTIRRWFIGWEEGFLPFESFFELSSLFIVEAIPLFCFFELHDVLWILSLGDGDEVHEIESRYTVKWVSCSFEKYEAKRLENWIETSIKDEIIYNLKDMRINIAYLQKISNLNNGRY